MKAYSNDFRQKIVETNRRNLESIGQTATRFQVSYSFVGKLIKGYEQTGLVSPKPHGGGAKSKFNSSQLAVVAELIAPKNHATLEELVIQLEETIGVTVSRATMGRVVLKLKLTRKKNFALLQSEKPSGYSSCESSRGMRLGK
jgi:transposase